MLQGVNTSVMRWMFERKNRHFHLVPGGTQMLWKLFNDNFSHHLNSTTLKVTARDFHAVTMLSPTLLRLQAMTNNRQTQEFFDQTAINRQLFIAI